MNTTQLQCFTTLAHTLNYMRAAEELNMTQPAVSRQIQSLEQELGAQLFHRTTRSVSLTQIGLSFLPEATSMLKAYYRSVEAIRNFHTASEHVLRIGYWDTQAMPQIGRFLAPLMKAHPNLTPSFTLDQSDANLERLTKGELDLVFGIRDAKFAHPSIEFRELRREFFLCACAKEHPIAQHAAKEQRDTVSSAELFPYRQILSIPPYLLRNAFSLGHHILPVNEDLANILCENTSEACALAQTGIGFTFVPSHLFPENTNLTALHWKESPHTTIGVYASKAAFRDKSSMVTAFYHQALLYYQKETSADA